MASFPTSAKVVIIGAGIVGNSIAYHLANLGWKDIVLIDKGPLPNPGGSTGHASNFLYLVDHNKEMAELTLESASQYREWDVYTECGGLEVARSETRMNELRRQHGLGQELGHRLARLVTPAEIKELVPFINEEILVGGFYTPSVGVCDSLRFGTLCREKAEEMGALAVVREHRGHRAWASRTAGSRASTTTPRHHRGRVRRHRLRRLGPAPGRDGRRAHPADARRPPDGRLRPRPAASRSRPRRSSTRSSATWTCSCTSARTASASRSGSYAHRSILHDPEDDPVDRGGGALARRSSPSPRTTSTRSSRTRSSCSPRSSATRRSARSTPSTA